MAKPTVTASQKIRSLFNGPLLAGIGATTDAGLSSELYHRVPWDMSKVHTVIINETRDSVRFQSKRSLQWGSISDVEALRWAKYNVDHVYGFAQRVGEVAALSEEDRSTLRRDMVAILFVAISYNYLFHETRTATTEEKRAAASIDATDIEEFVNVTTLNRAATWIMARMHTKYQTNHVLGGSPMQASMASVARALLNLTEPRTQDSRSRYHATSSALHWVLHPLNEQLLIPLAIHRTGMQQAEVASAGPAPEVMELDEYFEIRAYTPPASTHHFYVCAAAVRHLDPLGILQFLPQPTRLADVRTGWVMIAAHGAALHPAARFWGLNRISANQKLLEPLAADLGYAVKKIMPGSSLAASPILQKEDQLDSGWKTFVDAIRAAMDKRGEELVDASMLDDVKRAIAPTKQDLGQMTDVKKLLTDHDAITSEEIAGYIASSSFHAQQPAPDPPAPHAPEPPAASAPPAAPRTPRRSRPAPPLASPVEGGSGMFASRGGRQGRAGSGGESSSFLGSFFGAGTGSAGGEGEHGDDVSAAEGGGVDDDDYVGH
jgi:hypothetical protein